MDDCAEFEDKFKNQTLTFLGVTVNAWRGQPGDFVIRGSLQETVPDAEPISMPRALKVHEHLGHMSRNRKSLLNQSQLTCLCVCVGCCVHTLLRRGKKFLTCWIVFKDSRSFKASLHEMFVMKMVCVPLPSTVCTKKRR